MTLTSSSGVRELPDRCCFAKSASVSTKKSGHTTDRKKWSNHTDSSTESDCKNDLSKSAMGPTLSPKKLDVTVVSASRLYRAASSN